MNSFTCLFLAVTLSSDVGPRVQQPLGQLAKPQSSLHFTVQAPLTDYLPAPGDIVFSTSDKLRTSFFYRVALVGLPSHVGIMVRMPDGQFGVFEAGGGGELRTRTTPLEARFGRKGDRAIWIRKPLNPLTVEQELKLNEYAAVSENKGYSNRRALELAWIFLNGTRGPIRTLFVGKPKGFRDNYVCSEAVTEALVYAGLIDSETARPSATAPRDLMLDRSLNGYIRRHPPLACGWVPPALWVGCRAVITDFHCSPIGSVIPMPKRGLLRFRR